MLGENVRRLRLASGISQAKLAERMGVDRAYISGLEKGERNPTVLTVWHLSKALKVAMREFFEETAKSKRER
jgi:transcriptional regulator with XRE-family HTH domain